MRAIAPRWCSAASAAAAVAIRREIVARAGVFVRLPFVRRRRRRRPFHSRLLSAATASPIMGISLHKKEEKEEEQKAKAPASEESQSQSQSQSESLSLSQSLPPPPQKQEQKQEQLQAPEKPLPGDCCGSGCVRCVWDVYYDELDAYQKALSSAPAASNPKHN